MFEKIKDFIKNNSDFVLALKQDNLIYCYDKLVDYDYVESIDLIPDFTKFLMRNKIDPFNYINKIYPHQYRSLNIKSIKIPDKIKDIGEYSFCDCDKLKLIVIPVDVDTIGSYAFCNCYELEKVDFSDYIEKINDFTFCHCCKLDNVVIPPNVLTIGAGAFRGCVNLKSLVFNDGLEKIETCAFDGCKGLEEIKIPSSVTEIERLAFRDCKKLTEVSIPKCFKYQIKDIFYECNDHINFTFI